jgi:hypothetical protein
MLEKPVEVVLGPEDVRDPVVAPWPPLAVVAVGEGPAVVEAPPVVEPDAACKTPVLPEVPAPPLRLGEPHASRPEAERRVTAV